jgi:hypothetical protein
MEETHTMRTFCSVGLFDAVVLAAILFFASAVAAEIVSVFDAERPGYDPCRDGRFSDGRAMNCDELLQRLDREEEERRYRFGDPARRGDDPCRDGRYSTGRPMTCAELRERLDRRERRLHRRSYDAYGPGQVVEPIFIQ